MVNKASLILLAAVLVAVIAGKEIVEIEASYHSVGAPVVVELTRGPFTMLEFRPKSPEPRAIILFASGDGGWSAFEEEIGCALQDQGYEVVGINSDDYAKTDYDLATLQADFGTMARKVEAPYGEHAPPLIVAGWSMGAAQAIAVAGGPHPPQGLTGLLALDPCSRGRYGLRLSDRTDFLPTGPGTFGVDEFAATMGNLRVVQWHAAEDAIDSRSWLTLLTAPHREFDFARSGHYYNVGREEFLRQLAGSVPWLLSSGRERVTSMGDKP